jgi:gliding motility-associated-like protein
MKPILSISTLKMKVRSCLVCSICRWTVVFVSLGATAQAPFVSSISKTVGKVNENVSISGINFGSVKANIKVRFGGVTADPTSISDQFIDVKVPTGASLDFIKVFNTATGLSGASQNHFSPSFGGENPFDPAKVSAQMDFNSESGLYEVAIADFDGDGKLDMATSNNNATMISIFRNTSAVGAFSFSKTTINVGVKSIHVAANDINGDGKSDLVISESSATTTSRLFVYQNTSTVGSITFTPQTISFPGNSKVNQIKIEDLDLDGKPDLIISDQYDNDGARLFIIKNQSSVATISLAAPQALYLSTEKAGTDGMGIADLNGDKYPDIVVGEFLTATTNIFVIRNASTPGTINLVNQTPIGLSTTVSNFAIGDLNSDGKPDVAITLLLSSTVMVFGNNTTGNQIEMAAGVTFSAGIRPWGIDIGDVDGDGKLDLITASISGDPPPSGVKTVTVLNNQSVGSTFSFNRQQLNTTFINRIVKLADMDSDNRPDIVFTSVDDNTNGISASKVSLIRNVNCVVPVASPLGPLTICNGFAQRLESSVNPSATYQWFKGGVSIGAPSATSFVDVNVSGSGLYTVQMVEGSCSKTSNGVQINVINAAPLGPATISPVTPVCVGGSLNLSVSNVGATQYSWTGPGGFSANGLNVSRANFQPSMAGEYKLDIITSTCIAEQLSVIVDVVSVPGVSVQFSGAPIICDASTKQLTVLPSVSGYTYQWAEETSGNISGATNADHTVSTTGKYLVKLKSVANSACPEILSPTQKIRVANTPVVDFSNPAQICTGQDVEFVDQSVVDIDPEDPLINYVWDFGDGTDPSTIKNPTHVFASAITANVSLEVSYSDNACPGSVQKSLTITAAPLVQITNPDDLYAICNNDSLKLEVLGSFTNILWGPGQTTSFIYVHEPGTYTVDVTVGCVISASRVVTRLTAPPVTVTADPQTINLGESTELRATGLQDYNWEPSESVDDPTAAITNASPAVPTTYTVTGRTSNGCIGQGSVFVGIIGQDPLSALTPTNFFTPNGDDINPVWVVTNLDIMPQCGVTIFDERGFKVHDAKPYLNDWDGTSSKGGLLPAGVYFYIIRCDDSKKTLTGSINLIR